MTKQETLNMIDEFIERCENSRADLRQKVIDFVNNPRKMNDDRFFAKLESFIRDYDCLGNSIDEYRDRRVFIEDITEV